MHKVEQVEAGWVGSYDSSGATCHSNTQLEHPPTTPTMKNIMLQTTVTTVVELTGSEAYAVASIEKEYNRKRNAIGCVLLHY